jgi:uncharacterized membrane protein
MYWAYKRRNPSKMTQSNKPSRSIYQLLTEYDRRIIYLLIFILVLAPLMQPFILPIQVSSDTQLYYDQLNGLKSGDKVMFLLDTEFSGYMELQSGIVASLRILLQHHVNLCIIESHPEATGIPTLLYAQVQDVMNQNNYVYGTNYIDLGYVFPNEAAVASAAQNFHNIIRTDRYGKSIQGTFLDSVNSYNDWTMIDEFTTGVQSEAVVRHFGQSGTPIVANVIGVMVATSMPYLQAGLYKAVLQSMRGGAELEYLISAPGAGLTAMNSFTLGHYMLIVAIVLGNIGYFGYRSEMKKKKMEVQK